MAKSNINTERVYSFEVQCHAEVRRCERKESVFTNAKGEEVRSVFLELTCEDDDLNRFYLRDRLLDNEGLYPRGAVGVFVLQIHVEEKFRGKTTIGLKSFTPDE